MTPTDKPKADDTEPTKEEQSKPEEIGGSDKPDPVRYGDWEIGGKCVDF